ncbi:hypothetical protein GCM10022420_094840 [Streptomyces iranensis]
MTNGTTPAAATTLSAANARLNFIAVPLSYRIDLFACTSNHEILELSVAAGSNTFSCSILDVATAHLQRLVRVEI